MLDQTGSSTIRVLPLHIAIPTPKLLLVNLLRPVTHRIPIGILLSQPPCVPVNWLLGTLTRHFPTSEIKIFLSNAQVRRQSLLSNAYTFNNNHKLWFTTQAVHGTLLLFLIWILYFLCIGLFSPIITIYNQEGCNLKNPQKKHPGQDFWPPTRIQGQKLSWPGN